MPPTTGYSFGDVVLVPFPFTDQAGIKKRPAVIISSAAYNTAQRDLVIMAVTKPVETVGRARRGARRRLAGRWPHYSNISVALTPHPSGSAGASPAIQ